MVGVSEPGPSPQRNIPSELIGLRENRHCEEQRLIQAAPIELPRAALALSIYLPTGSEAGNYQVEIMEQPGKPLIGAEGTATLRNHIAVLEVSVDLQRLHPGLYLVGIRQAGWSWAYYPVVLK
jgi:hypothetical protein